VRKDCSDARSPPFSNNIWPSSPGRSTATSMAVSALPFIRFASPPHKEPLASGGWRAQNRTRHVISPPNTPIQKFLVEVICSLNVATLQYRSRGPMAAPLQNADRAQGCAPPAHNKVRL